MRFSKLRLTGFKSFVDPTDLIIADGLTGVVGPNGCGKSNLLEALRWVMGESRPKAMRGGGMEDVIFAGAASRPARNFAEVALQIDNSNRLAPAAFNNSDALDIVRRITRDMGSSYRVNSKDVRARDVQMLFADASSGAHSPALVRQGQISELINAKPTHRRRILEEAAGISGLYQRRHEAELKLRSAETNLGRVEDVLEQLATQLAQLARQAKQAARYRKIAAQIRQLDAQLLLLRWKEAQDVHEAKKEELRLCTVNVAQAEAKMRIAEQARGAAEEQLPPTREEETIATAVLQRQLVEQEGLVARKASAIQAIKDLTARAAQLNQDIAREAELNSDAQTTVARLAKEAESLEQADHGHEQRLDDAHKAVQEALIEFTKHEADLTKKTDEFARLSAHHHSAQRRLSDSKHSLARHEDAVEKADIAQAQARETFAASTQAFDAAIQEQARAETALKEAEATLETTGVRRAQAEQAEAAARQAHAEQSGALSALQAEATTLEKLVARGKGKTEQILDQITVVPGYEQALGAALSEDLTTPAVPDAHQTGWRILPAISNSPSPEGGQVLKDYVKGARELMRRLSEVYVIDPAQAAELQAKLAPGQRLVSRAGDLWRWDGFSVQAKDSPSAAALRLQQKNRLIELTAAVAETSKRAERASNALQNAKAALQKAQASDNEARGKRRAAERLLIEASRALSKAEAGRNLSESALEDMSRSLKTHQEDVIRARFELAEAERAVEALEDLSLAQRQIEDLRSAVERARAAMVTRKSVRDEVQRTHQARTNRARTVAKELSVWQTRFQKAEMRARELRSRRAEAQAELAAAEKVPGQIEGEQARLTQALSRAEARRASARERLTSLEGALREAQSAEREIAHAVSAAREARARAEAQEQTADEAVQIAHARLTDELGESHFELLDSVELGAGDLELELARLKRQRDGLGAVNLRAEEDARQVQNEHDMLAREKLDLEEAIKALRSGISGLNKEGRERLLTAFEQVNSNFAMLFTHLFGGGEANLVMVESDDPLEAGLEIMCQPPGKKLSTLSLLSGGEQTLTALALIFAVFLANPAPICVLDEVDAPLDDANVTRFCDLLDEMCRQTETRFLIITHHAVTMARMDRLFGVTMAEQGVSQLVSVDLKKAETLVA